MPAWSLADIPSQRGKLAVVTGATGGLGYETALGLAGAGAEVVLTGRSAEKGAAALTGIRAAHPDATISYEHLDLASLASIRAFVARFSAAHQHIEILINNAGVMAPPERKLTEDGFELQLGTNYLGHFVLTAGLLPLLVAGHARVISLASLAARRGRISFDDLQRQRYSPFDVYAQSKLACLLFAQELQRRSDAAGWGIISVAAHPGVSTTNLIKNGMGVRSLAARVSPITGLIFQSAAKGALPTLYAATSPQVVPGGYYGPDGFLEFRGAPRQAVVPRGARDPAIDARLWQVSQELTGSPFPAAGAAG